MFDPLTIALKEWAAICRALGTGKQSVIVRKGGIAEATDEFRLEATRFLLYPTYVHQQETGLRSDANSLLEDARREQPGEGIVRIDSWADVTGVYQVRDLLPAHLIAHLHCWSDEAIEKRYHYRRPGVNVLAVRVYRLPAPVEFGEAEAYRGCKSWVPLTEGISLDGSIPVLSDEHYREVIEQLDTLLRPTALA